MPSSRESRYTPGACSSRECRGGRVQEHQDGVLRSEGEVEYEAPADGLRYGAADEARGEDPGEVPGEDDGVECGFARWVGVVSGERDYDLGEIVLMPMKNAIMRNITKEWVSARPTVREAEKRMRRRDSCRRRIVSPSGERNIMPVAYLFVKMSMNI